MRGGLARFALLSPRPPHSPKSPGGGQRRSGGVKKGRIMSRRRAKWVRAFFFCARFPRTKSPAARRLRADANPEPAPHSRPARAMRAECTRPRGVGPGCRVGRPVGGRSRVRGVWRLRCRRRHPAAPHTAASLSLVSTNPYLAQQRARAARDGGNHGGRRAGARRGNGGGVKHLRGEGARGS